MRATLKRQYGRLYEIPLLIMLVLLLAMGFASSGFSWRALIAPGLVLGILFGLALIGMTLASIGQAWERRHVRRQLDRLLAGAPAAPIVASIRDASWHILREESLKREAIFDLATQPGPSRAAVLGLFVHMTDDALRAKLRPLLRARLAHVEEAEFEGVMLMFYGVTDTTVGAALLARASPHVRGRVLEQIVSGYSLAQIRKNEAEWARQWGPVIAPYREQLAAIRNPARTRDAEAIDALLAAAP